MFTQPDEASAKQPQWLGSGKAKTAAIGPPDCDNDGDPGEDPYEFLECTTSPTRDEQGGAPNESENPTTCSTAQPVNCATGVFWHQFTDASIPGIGIPLEFKRTYSSSNAATDGPLGFGWSYSYGISLTIDEETGAATIHEATGSSVTFPSSGEGGFMTPPHVLASLQADGEGLYTFSRFANHIRYVFSSTGRLLREVDRNGNTTTLSYGEGRLQTVTDQSGRTLTLSYTGSHLYTLTDPMGRTTTFEYDGNGNLVKATDSLGRSWAFAYDASHRLLTMTDPRKGVLHNKYDSSGKVVAQVDPMGRETTWKYEDEFEEGECEEFEEECEEFEEGEYEFLSFRRTVVTDPRGDATAYEYLGLFLLSVTRGLGSAAEATTSFEYDPGTLGKTVITDPDGRVTYNEYDPHGNLLSSTDPLGNTTDYTYGPADEALTITDPRGTTTTFRYDEAGNLLEQETPDTEASEVVRTQFAYEGAPGEVTGITNPDGHTTTIEYDSAGDPVAVIDPAGDTTTATYDADGQRLSSVSPAGNEEGADPADFTTTFAYDASGQLLSITNPLGQTASCSYDADGNCTSATDAVGRSTSFVFNADNELVKEVRADGTIRETHVDAVGNIVAQVDGAGHATTYEYDALDRPISVTDPLGRGTEYTYDPAGRKLTETNASGEVTYYSYDAAGELIGTEYSDGITPSVSEEYDADGNRVKLSDGTGTSTFTYDSLNRLTESTDGSGKSVAYSYDPGGNITHIRYPNGKTVVRTFDSVGRLASVSDWLGNTSQFNYGADSTLTEELYGNGVTAMMTYDAADRVKEIVDKRGEEQLASFGYTRDPLGQVSKEAYENGEGGGETSFARDALNQLTQAGETKYGYDVADNPTTLGEVTQQFDAANELTSVTAPGEVEEEAGEQQTGSSNSGDSSPPPGPTPNPKPRSKRHCRKGFKRRKVHGKARCVRKKKRKHKRHHRRHKHRAKKHRAVSPRQGGYRLAGPPMTAMEVPKSRADDIATSPSSALPVSAATAQTSLAEVTRPFAYNARGDRTMEPLLSGGSRSLVYDQADRLIAVGSDISYAYNGDGLRTSKTVNDQKMSEVWNQAATVPELLQSGPASYLYGPNGQPIEQITGGDIAIYLQADQQGSIRLLSDSAGTVVGNYDYDLWGNIAKHEGSATSELQYDGQLSDLETGFQYLRTRYFNSATGQFISSDPRFRFTRSRYGYANNNPVDWGDPTGLGAEPAWIPIAEKVGSRANALATLGTACLWQGACRAPVAAPFVGAATATWSVIGLCADTAVWYHECSTDSASKACANSARQFSNGVIERAVGKAAALLPGGEKTRDAVDTLLGVFEMGFSLSGGGGLDNLPSVDLPYYGGQIAFPQKGWAVLQPLPWM
ncbi:MAG TPA: DUF6531 domain-containing protein [Solirubrobacterales bacterium]